MDRLTHPLYIVGAVVILAAAWAVMAYNRFVSLATRVQEAWSDIDVQLKRRYDLIPNLVETVKGYAAHEVGTLQKVTEMRTQAMNATGPHDKAAAEDMLRGALKSIFALSENYPNLRANENFVELQRELSDTDNKIQAARRFYNSVVQDLNAAIQMFPSNIIASLAGFKQSEFFSLGESENAAKQPIQVKF